MREDDRNRLYEEAESKEFNAIGLVRKKNRGQRGFGINGHTPTMPRSISTKKGETRNTHFRGENIRREPCFSDTDYVRIGKQNRRGEGLLTLKYRILSDV